MKAKGIDFEAICKSLNLDDIDLQDLKKKGLASLKKLRDKTGRKRKKSRRAWVVMALVGIGAVAAYSFMRKGRRA